MAGHSTPRWEFQTYAGNYEPKLSVSSPRWAVLPHVGSFDFLLRCSILRWALRPHFGCYNLVLGLSDLRWLVSFTWVVVCQQAARGWGVERVMWPAPTQPCWSLSVCLFVGRHRGALLSRFAGREGVRVLGVTSCSSCSAPGIVWSFLHSYFISGKRGIGMGFSPVWELGGPSHSFCLMRWGVCEVRLRERNIEYLAYSLSRNPRLTSLTWGAHGEH
jgi:hypothetical protein